MDKTEPIQLQTPDGDPLSVWICPKCKLAWVHDIECARRCCAPCECGKERSQGALVCEECWQVKIVQQAQKNLDAAKEVTDYHGMMYSDQLQGSRDGYYDTMEEVTEAIFYALQEGQAIKQPFYIHTCDVHTKGLDLDRALEDLVDDTYEDAEPPSGPAVVELQKHVDKFNETNSIVYFTPNYSEKVRVPFVNVETGDIVPTVQKATE